MKPSHLTCLCHAPFRSKRVKMFFPISRAFSCFITENVWRAPSHRQLAAEALDPGLQALLLQRSHTWTCCTGNLTASGLDLAISHQCHSREQSHTGCRRPQRGSPPPTALQAAVIQTYCRHHVKYSRLQGTFGSGGQKRLLHPEELSRTWMFFAPQQYSSHQ